MIVVTRHYPDGRTVASKLTARNVDAWIDHCVEADGPLLTWDGYNHVPYDVAVHGPIVEDRWGGVTVRKNR